MNILFDFVSFQDSYINGGSFYTYEILSNIVNIPNVKLFPCMRKNLPLLEKVEKFLSDKTYEICFLENENQAETILDFVNSHKIEVFFIGIAQRYNNIDLTSIPCRIVMTCHDLGDRSISYVNLYNFEEVGNFMRKYVYHFNNFGHLKHQIKFLIKQFLKGDEPNTFYLNFQNLIKKQNVYLVTDSEYSKSSINYFIGDAKNDIKVLYPPEKRICLNEKKIENQTLSKLLNSNTKYFLLINCDRMGKNTAIFVKQWERFCKSTNYEYSVLLIGKHSFKGDNTIQINNLSENDLELAYKNAFAFVYPSLAEGFGYPPLEAMKYGTPAICSNVTSIPEIMEQSVIYFSPYYPEDLYRAMKLMTVSREKYSKLGIAQQKKVSKKQNEDLKKAIELIINKDISLIK